MLRYTGKRALQLLPVIFGVTFAVFLLSQIIPGDIADVRLGGNASEAEKQALRDELGLDRNIFLQYLIYLGNLLRGDLGVSTSFHQPALDVLLSRLVNTAVIAVPAVVVAAVLGIALGSWAALKANSLRDRGLTVFVLVLTSMPSFWLGLILIMLFGLTLGWLPVSGMRSVLGGGGLGDVAAHAILPVLTLAAWSVAVIARMTRASMLDVMSSDFVRSARSRGTPEHKVVYRHALPNAMPPVITVVGLQAGFLLSGAVLTETVFAWPGIGLALSQAISQRDTVLLQGGILVIAVIFVLINFVVDILYAYFNPKIKLS
ncbi:ABC transporter permease [Saccharopolyspora sp. ASAGF58]|uniref:ABC transporter permease n=1 Tax=Saccharopolyspora sp. ASAGF58 TaxID=2719023 RepID=UPI00143FE559|nr:ABC transporter permease [Saccharopolyspora sp. ASAGF58]QIZ38617.1 ABC transporter permease [Saccharopolyspora sp. ASAGF58]